jgi:predicted neuraminidase
MLVAACAAFAASGWKAYSREPAPDFAAVQAIGSPAGLPVLTKPVQPSGHAELFSTDGRTRFNAGFVSSVPGRAVHSASLVELSDGRLRAVWFAGSREGAGDVAIQTAVMDASTLQWGAEATLFDRQRVQSDLWRYVKKLGNPVIGRGPDGALYLWMVNVSLGGWAGSSISWSRSVDEGVSWSGLRRLVTSPFLNVSTLVKGASFDYANGQMGLPVYHEFLSKFAEVLRLDARGQVIDKIRINASQTSLQPVLLVTGAATAQAYMRSGTATALMLSSTQDAGNSWSATHAGQLPNPDSSLAGLVGHDGRQWLVLNPTVNNRETLALAAGGKTGNFDVGGLRPLEVSATPGQRASVEQYEVILGKELSASGASSEQVRAYVASARRQLCGLRECSQEFSYPSLLQSRDGHLHLVYTWHRTRIKHIRLDLTQDSLVQDAAARN